MAIAAGLEAPRVLIADWPSQNGAVFGTNDGSAVVVVSRQLIQSVDRAQLQAIAGKIPGLGAHADKIPDDIGDTLGGAARSLFGKKD